MAETIYISKLDETYVHIDASTSVLYELAEKFTFLVPNSQHMQAVKEKAWDGKVRLFCIRTQTLYTGLHSYVKEYADQEGYECVYVDPIDVEAEFSVVEARKMFAALKLSSLVDGKRIAIEPHDYQERAVIHGIQAKRSLLLSPTASGKSLLIYCLIRYYLAKQKGSILVIVPNVGLVKQLVGDFRDYCEWDSTWNADEHCHMIYQGQNKDTEKRVVVSTWQSIYKMRPSYFHKFTVVLGDECHLFAAKQVSTLMKKLVRAKYRFGTTGTIQNSKTYSMALEGLFGRVYKTTTTKELMDQKKVADLNIKCLQFRYRPEERKQIKRVTYHEEIDFLVAHHARNCFIRNLALSLKGNVLILFNYVEKHGKLIHELIEEKKGEDRRTFFIHGKTHIDDRDAIRGIVEKETDAIMTASFGTYSTGVNIRNIDFIILASPILSNIRVGQSLGRGLRLSQRKTALILFDLSDDLTSYNKHNEPSWENYSLLHFMERLNYYYAEQFNTKMYKIELGIQ